MCGRLDLDGSVAAFAFGSELTCCWGGGGGYLFVTLYKRKLRCLFPDVKSFGKWHFWPMSGKVLGKRHFWPRSVRVWGKQHLRPRPGGASSGI